MHPIIEQNLPAIRALAREYGVTRLEVFGSVCTPEFDPERSDVDFIVAYPKDHEFGPRLGRFFEFQRELAALLDRSVDLVMADAPAMQRKWFRRLADETRTVIYDESQVAALA